MTDADCIVSGHLEHLSDAYRQTLVSDEYRKALGALAADIEVLRGLVLAGLDAAAARVLLIHRWRRVVLRFLEIAPELMPLDCALRDPRQGVAQAYGRLVGPAEIWLSAPLTGESPMPAADATLAERFAEITGP